MVDSRLIISLLGEVRELQDTQENTREMASHKNMAGLFLEKAMVMEEYIMSPVMNGYVHDKL
jgi:hypothetical protein